ncbi:amidohydrolase family protein [Chitinophagaceae bacterium LB-8]|uniref:Amidohydrolase family protein n=1 Tax=Paraflavisolibacter caeni TaxID=2982496 RepID=A0A9X2XX07_9BACT|nr:amidohydrolase family protein [Paraflavisolibacter caeni]MCU7550465.1 amidohydrolase family protein [Paraflavisolibacter caeni]
MKREKLFLITDSSFLGRKLKEFEWEFIDAKLIDGFYRNKEGNLAGASISMVEAVQNAIQYLNVTVEEAVSMATLRVAKAIKMDHNLGAIKVGYPASFIKFSNDFKQYETMIF